jgi:ubiquinone/menaquinone biosynthesis C-methylase UbiE
VNYDLLAADYAANRRVHPAILTKLLAAAGSLRADTVVDIGCGTGNYAAALRETAGPTGALVLGVEPSYGMLAYAQARGISVCQGQAETIPLATAAAGLLFSVDVIHHVRTVPAYFAEARRVLRPGGLICTATDSEEIIATRRPLAAYWPETIPSELERYHPISRLTQWLEAAGFQDVRDQEVEFAYLLHDAEPYRRRAYSTLQRIDDEAWRCGLERLETDLACGPVPCTSRYTLVWGEVPAA